MSDSGDTTTQQRVLPLPAMGLVVLVGVSGSGKSTFAARHFLPTQVVSSDAYRGVVSDDENDQSATGDAFDLVHRIVGKRLRRGLLTVVDATNVQREDRGQLVRLAKEHDVPASAIVLDASDDLVRERTRLRTDRDIGPDALARQQHDLSRSRAQLDKEGFRRVHVLDADEAGTAVVELEPSPHDRRELSGPFDIMGDVHGCRAELEDLLTDLGYRIERDDAEEPTGAHHPDGRTAVFVGDVVDRGPDSPGAARLVMNMVDSGDAMCVLGNHEHKLLRALNGRNVRLQRGLEQTLDQLESHPVEFRERLREFCDGLVSHYVLDGGDLVIAHAGLKEAYHGRSSGRVRSFALFGDTTGETDEQGLPVRLPWAREYQGRAMVVYGHVPTPRPEWVNNTICLDTGCVFGGELTALRYPERELRHVPAHDTWYEPTRPLHEESAGT